MAAHNHACAAIVRQYKAPLSVEDVEIEAPRANEVLVRMVSSGICHTDLVFRDGDGFALPIPCVLGHEGAGVVEVVGSDVRSVAPGDHVILTVMSCGKCANCLRGLPSYCVDCGPLNYSGGRFPDGTSPVSIDCERINAAFFSQSSFATLAIANERNTLKVTSDVPLHILGPLSCGFQTGAGAVWHAIKLQAGETLAIFGAGAVGFSALLAARAVDAGDIYVVEPVASRRQLALELGAAGVIDPAAVEDVAAEIIKLSSGGVNHAIDPTGIPDVVAVASNVLMPTGMLVTARIPPMEASLPVNMLGLMSGGICIKGVCVGDTDPRILIPRMIGLYRDGRFPFDLLIQKFKFADVNEAIDASHSGSVIKAVLTY
jgi:Zn-dependent alcohol dehydrogenase